jgi:proliferating cell nuclear antigen
MGKIIEIQTDQVLVIKLLIEVLKEILNDVTIEVIRDDSMNKAIASADDDNLNEENSENEEENDEKSDIDEVEEIINELPKKGKKKLLKEKESKKKSLLKKNQEKQNKNIKKDDDDSKWGGLKIMTVDPSKTLLIQMKLNSKQFSVFKCKPASYDICISLVQLHRLLKSLDQDDTLAICIDDDDEQHVVLKVDNEEKKFESTYRLKLMDLDKKSYKIPPIAFDAVITLDATEFHKICREMSNIAEFVEIKVTPNSLTYSCTGDTADRSTTYYPGDNGIKIKFGTTKDQVIQAIFELKYLVLFTKCANLCNDIQIFMKNRFPLVIKYTVATLGKIMLCLAPVNETHTKGSFSDDEAEYENEETKPKLKA